MNQMNHQIMYSRATVVQLYNLLKSINGSGTNFCQLNRMTLARLAKSKTNAGSPDRCAVLGRICMYIYIYNALS